MISANICAHINSYDYKKEGDLVRSETVHYQLYDTLVGSGPAILFTIFVGKPVRRYHLRTFFMVGTYQV